MPFKSKRERLQHFYKGFDTCVISGGSSGMGRAFLRILAEINPDMSAINLSRLAAVDWGFKRFKNIGCDFTSQESSERAFAELEEEMKKSGGGKILLINNAGIGEYGNFFDSENNHFCDIISVNDIAPLKLTKAMCPYLIKNGGAILNVCSTAAFQPTPFMGTYGASKAFLLNWSIALAAEMSAKGCTVSALCPGPMSTDFFAKAGFDSSILPDSISISVEKVAEYGLGLIMKRKIYGIAGYKNRFLIFLSKLVPLSLSGKLAKFALMRSFNKANSKKSLKN